VFERARRGPHEPRENTKLQTPVKPKKATPLSYMPAQTEHEKNRTSERGKEETLHIEESLYHLKRRNGGRIPPRGRGTGQGSKDKAATPPPLSLNKNGEGEMRARNPG